MDREIKMEDNMGEELIFSNAKQSGKTTKYSYGEKGNRCCFTIEQGDNKVFLRQSQVLFIIEKGQQMIKRWKVD